MKISVIGTGRVATILAQQCVACGHQVHQIWGRNTEKAHILAYSVGAVAVSDVSNLDPEAEVYLVAVSDGAIENVAQQIQSLNLKGVVAHTSGAVPSTIFAPYLTHFGSFYPLQTFSVGRQPNFSTLPLFINANTTEGYARLSALAHSIGGSVKDISDADRVVLHVAAVFVNNFTNHLYHIGAQILEKRSWPIELLMPLVQETVDKLGQMSPADSQTGPAIRGDQKTIEQHLTFLEAHTPQYAAIYRSLSQSINPHINFE